MFLFLVLFGVCCISFVERSLGKFVDEKKFGLLKDKGLPIEGCAVVAGRTDKGVTAFQQVCSFCMCHAHASFFQYTYKLQYSLVWWPCMLVIIYLIICVFTLFSLMAVTCLDYIHETTKTII